MHMLDFISSVSRSSKCTKIVGGWNFTQTPLEEHSAPQTPYPGLRGPTSKGPYV